LQQLQRRHLFLDDEETPDVVPAEGKKKRADESTCTGEGEDGWNAGTAEFYHPDPDPRHPTQTGWIGKVVACLYNETSSEASLELDDAYD